MYLSYLLINSGDNPDRPRPGRLWLRNVYRVHQRLCMGFPSAERKEHDPLFLQPYKPGRFPEDHYLADKKKLEMPENILKQVHSQRDSQNGFLFRIDPLPAGRAVIIVQSAIEPDWDYAFRNAMHLLAAPPQIKPYDPHFQDRQLLIFRLLANPTRKRDKENRPEGRNNWGRRVPVLRNEIEAWLTARAGRYGFSVESFDNVQTGYITAFKNKNDDSQITDEETEGRLKRFFYARYEGKLRVNAPDSFRNAIIQGIGPAKGFGFGLLSVVSLKG